MHRPPAFHRLPVLLLLLLAAVPATAQSLQDQVAAQLAQAGPGTRFGMVVVDAEGREILAIRPDERFTPASTTKLMTTAAVFARLPVDRPDAEAGTAVRLEGDDVVLEGHGDARLSSADDCTADCLATLADAVAGRTRAVNDVIGDDRAFVDLRWSPGMSWNNIGTRSGAAVSALTLDDNQAPVRIAPAEAEGPLRVAAPPFWTLDNRTATVVGQGAPIMLDRAPFDRVLHLTGTLAAGSAPLVRRVPVDDPAEWAAWRFKAMLEARGVAVRGTVRVRHRSGRVPPEAAGAAPLAQLVPPPLVEDLRHTNKTSDNLHAELLLRRLGDGSIEAGEKAVEDMLAEAGLPRWSYGLADGSGMSTYNRITPRAMVRFLRWAQVQPWGDAWRETLPVGGADGTLARRFRREGGAGRILAKTGTLAGIHALAGYIETASGQRLCFALYASDATAGAPVVTAMDAAVALVAAQSEAAK